MKALNGCAQEDLMEAMHAQSCSATTSGGNGSFPFGSNGCAGPLEADMGLEPEAVPMDGSSVAPKELEIITVASMHIPCRVTNSYAYL